MISLFEGRLGGGKTYHAVIEALDHWCKGGVVCSNVEFKWDAIKSYGERKFGLIFQDTQLIQLTDEQIGLFHRYTPTGTPALPVKVIIDEAHLTFNARAWSHTHKEYGETLTFLTQSRKVFTDIIFIAQSVLNMDKQFMRLVQYIWRFRDLSKWRVPVLGIYYPFSTMLAVQYDYDGKTVLQKAFCKKDPEIFALYNTNSLLRQFPRLENHATTHKLESTVKRSRPMWKFLLVAFAAVCLFLGYKVYQFKSSDPLASPSPRSSSALAPKPSASPRSSLSGDDSDLVGQGLYDIYSERFIAWNGPERSLKTDRTWYAVGEMSPRGYVTAVSSKGRVKLLQPNGRTGWVVATKDAIPKPVPPVASVQPTATPVITIAPDSAHTEMRVLSETRLSKPTPTPTDYERSLLDYKTRRIPTPAPADH